jgi:hypothetical protein
MHEGDADLDWLRAQVDAALADVRRQEATGPALAFGVLLGTLSLLIFVIGLVVLFA